jgi:hypothetical protein
MGKNISEVIGFIIFLSIFGLLIDPIALAYLGIALSSYFLMKLEFIYYKDLNKHVDTELKYF